MSSHVRQGLGTCLTPHRVSVHSPSYRAPHEQVPDKRYGAAGFTTKHMPLYNGNRTADQTQVLPRTVPTPDLAFPRHSSKNETSYSGYMLKHTGLSNKWERRWFVLEGGFLKYFYEAEGHGINAVPKGVISMSSYTVHDGDDELQMRNCIILKPIFPGDHEYRLALESAFQKRTWTGKLSTGSHKGRIKSLMVGAIGVGKTALVSSFFENRRHEVEMKASNPSLGSHVGYIPAPESHRKDIVMPFGAHGQSVVSIECWENPGRGDWEHVRNNTYHGADVVIAVFSTADRETLAELERTVQVEVKKHAVDVPIFLVGTKTDLRDGRRPEPVVGHAQHGSRGHLTPRQRQEFNCVSWHDGKEAAERMGARQYSEINAFASPQSIEEIFMDAAEFGLQMRNPALAAQVVAPAEDPQALVTTIDQKLAPYATSHDAHLKVYLPPHKHTHPGYPNSASYPVESFGVPEVPSQAVLYDESAGAW